MCFFLLRNFLLALFVFLLSFYVLCCLSSASFFFSEESLVFSMVSVLVLLWLERLFLRSSSRLLLFVLVV